MLLTIARHEFRDVLRDGRVRLASFIVLLLLLVSMLTGWAYQRAVAAEHDSAARLSRDTWLAQSAKDPHSAAHYGAYVFKPRGPLTLIDTGVNPYTGVAVWLEAHKQNEFQFRPAQDRAAVARLGQLTAAATLQVLVPILVILLAFTKFAGEREDGTLRQVLAAGVAPGVLARGKALGVAGALAVAVVPAVVLGSAALLTTSGIDAMSQSGTRFAVLAGAYGVYVAIFVGLSLTVSAMARKASVALAVLIALWAGNAILAPRLASEVSRTLYPTPAAFEFQQAVQRDTYDGLPVHDYNVRRAADLRGRLFAQYGVSRVEDLPVNFRGIDYLEREAHSNDVWEKHYTTLWSAFEAQTRIHQAAGFVAPLMAVRAVSMAMTGGDFHHHRHFAEAAEGYRRRLVLAMNSDLAYRAGSGRQGAYAADPALWATIGAFKYDLPPVQWALAHATQPTLGLMAWLLLSLGAFAFAARRVSAE